MLHRSSPRPKCAVGLRSSASRRARGRRERSTVSARRTCRSDDERGPPLRLEACIELLRDVGVRVTCDGAAAREVLKLAVRAAAEPLRPHLAAVAGLARPEGQILAAVLREGLQALAVIQVLIGRVLAVADGVLDSALHLVRV